MHLIGKKYIFTLIPLITSKAEHQFICLITIYLSCFEMCLSLSFAIFYWDIYKELLQIRKTIVKISILSYAVNIFIQLFIFDVIDDLKIVS